MPNQTDLAARRRTLLWVLGLAFVLRLVLAAATEGYPYDTSCFLAWGTSCWRKAPPTFTPTAILPTIRPATCTFCGWRRRCGRRWHCVGQRAFAADPGRGARRL